MHAQRFAARMSRDKANTLLLVAAAALVLAPHVTHLPVWVSLATAGTLGWRAAVTFRGWRLPPPLILLPATLAAMAGILYDYHTLVGRDAGVAMLAMLVAFKMLEMHAKRDLYVVIFLSFFLILTNFLYSQSLGTGAAMLASLLLLLTAQLSFQFTGTMPPLARRLRMTATVLLLALPVTLLLFVLFPRIQGPLWGQPSSGGGAGTGLSDTMEPGKISSLAQSDEPAFRVKFLDPPPPREQLYWRAVVLGDFDGATWTRGRRVRNGNISLKVSGAPVRQQITLEASTARWLFALDLPAQLPRVPGRHVGVTREFEIASDQPVEQRVRYDVVSYPEYSLEPEPDINDLARWLALPSNIDPRARAWARELARLPDPAERARTVLRRLHNENYVYTLEPPALPGANSIDDFLFGTRAGFCEHYAGSFVFLMRAAGVPARVVTGYQGGERNPLDGYYLVRQSDAHAWAEIWLHGRGWVRVDPTAAVAPERVRHGLAQALPQRAPFGVEGLRGLFDARNEHSAMARVRQLFSALNNSWNQWVLNYTPERQRGVMQTLTLLFANPRTFLGLAAAGMLLLLLRALRRRARTDPIDALYSALYRQLARRGLERAPDEGPTAFRQRVHTAAGALGNRAAIARFLALYSDYKYGAAAPAPGLAATLKRLLHDAR
jgi:transglutaminase-like putative cysteine protease